MTGEELLERSKPEEWPALLLAIADDLAARVPADMASKVTDLLSLYRAAMVHRSELRRAVRLVLKNGQVSDNVRAVLEAANSGGAFSEKFVQAACPTCGHERTIPLFLRGDGGLAECDECASNPRRPSRR